MACVSSAFPVAELRTNLISRRGANLNRMRYPDFSVMLFDIYGLRFHLPLRRRPAPRRKLEPIGVPSFITAPLVADSDAGRHVVVVVPRNNAFYGSFPNYFYSEH